jgi:hypothetical protein
VNTSSEEEEEEERDGGQAPREVESPAPVAMGREGGRRAGARGGRGGACHWVISGGIRERRGGAGERHGGTGGNYSGAPEPSRKKKRGLSNFRCATLPPCVLDFEGPVLTLVLSRSHGDTDRPRPCTRQGTQVGSIRVDEAAFFEGATGGSKCGGVGRAAARHGCGHKAAAGRDHNGGGVDARLSY